MYAHFRGYINPGKRLVPSHLITTVGESSDGALPAVCVEAFPVTLANVTLRMR